MLTPWAALHFLDSPCEFAVARIVPDRNSARAHRQAQLVSGARPATPTDGASP